MDLFNRYTRIDLEKNESGFLKKRRTVLKERRLEFENEVFGGPSGPFYKFLEGVFGPWPVHTPDRYRPEKNVLGKPCRFRAMDRLRVGGSMTPKAKNSQWSPKNILKANHGE